MNNRARLAITASTVVLAGASVAVIPTSASAQPRTSSDSLITWPASGTGGLILRDKKGHDLGSGIGENQNFEFNECGPKGSGLIYVEQLKWGSGGGWGDLYTGYVKIKYTKKPGMFNSLCNA